MSTNDLTELESIDTRDAPEVLTPTAAASVVGTVARATLPAGVNEEHRTALGDDEVQVAGVAEPPDVGADRWGLR